METEPLTVPEAGLYLWEWFFELSHFRQRAEGVCGAIPPSEFLAWREATDNIVYPHEYAIVAAMDVAYCEAMNTEISEYHERLKDTPSKG